MAHQLIFASNNAGKVAECGAVLAGVGWEVSSMIDFPDLAELEIEESGETFRENAYLKAQACADLKELAAVGDDSGLSIDQLGGWPGVKSKRWLAGTDQERNVALLEKIQNLSDRKARFITVLCLVQPGVPPQYFQGELVGQIAQSPRGTAGFGYDSIFIPAGFDQTLAELGMEIKNQISHRAQALTALAKYLQTIT